MTKGLPSLLNVDVSMVLPSRVFNLTDGSWALATMATMANATNKNNFLNVIVHVFYDCYAAKIQYFCQTTFLFPKKHDIQCEFQIFYVFLRRQVIIFYIKNRKE